MAPSLIEQIIAKYESDRQVIKEVKARQAEELRILEELQFKREQALLERAGIESFAFMTDLYINGRDGKSAKEKEKENIALNQAKIEAWLLKHLNMVGEGIKTDFGTVYKARKESVTCGDFEMFVRENMVKNAAKILMTSDVESYEDVVEILMENLHLELLTKAVRKESCLELMGEADKKTGARPNPPPAGANYTAIQTVAVRKPTK